MMTDSKPAKKLLVLLQNPYNKGKLDKWNPGVWKKEFASSRTGRRLIKQLPSDGWKVYYSNSNPTIGDGPDAKFQPDIEHVRTKLAKISPDVVLVCGKVAEEAIKDEWSGPIFFMPHPAHRFLTNELIEACCRVIKDWGKIRNDPDKYKHVQLCDYELKLSMDPCPKVKYTQVKDSYIVEDLKTGKIYGQ